MKKWGVIPAVALIVAGVVAIAGVYAANAAASGKGKWVQTLATIERVEPQSVAYRYNSGGRVHTSTAPLLPNDRFAPGGKVLIYVNPADRAQSLLRLPARPPQWPMVAGLVAVIVGVSLALYFWRATKTPPAAAQSAKSFDSTQKGKTPQRIPSPPMSRLRPPPQVIRKPAEDTTEEA
ncbi:MAG TPA: DUF3592 domain-containing protein [Thermoanaerobaculia bacterium]|jgi:hypothetical protein